MAAALKLISHKLCPYVQRAVIALTEKGVPFERVDIDLANKPDWFLAVSPLGKTPVLMVGDHAIFESAVILEYLEETQARPLHPAGPLRRAEHRAFIEFGSAVLNDIAGLYSAPDDSFSLVDAVFGPVFRYFDVFDTIGDFGILAEKPKLGRWRKSLAERPSVRSAVSADYPALLQDFIERRRSWLSQLQAKAAA
jgi:glutathione S-transferase